MVMSFFKTFRAGTCFVHAVTHKEHLFIVSFDLRLYFSWFYMPWKFVVFQESLEFPLDFMKNPNMDT